MAYNAHLPHEILVHPPKIYRPTLIIVTVGPLPSHREWNVLAAQPSTDARQQRFQADFMLRATGDNQLLKLLKWFLLFPTITESSKSKKEQSTLNGVIRIPYLRDWPESDFLWNSLNIQLNDKLDIKIDIWCTGATTVTVQQRWRHSLPNSLEPLKRWPDDRPPTASYGSGLRWRLIQFRFKVIKENDVGDLGISDRLLVIVGFAYRIDCMISVLPIAARNSRDEDKTDVII